MFGKSNMSVALGFIIFCFLGITIYNCETIDELRLLVNELRHALTIRGVSLDTRPGELLNQLLLIVNSSGLSPDSTRFLMDFIRLHAANLPTVEEINNIIEILKKIENHASEKNVGDIGDYLSKYFDKDGNNGGGSSQTKT